MSKCTKCGCNLIGTAANPPADQLCKYCQIDELKTENAKLRAAVVAFVGTDGESELASIENTIRTLPGDDDNRRVALLAIKTLRETLPKREPVPCPDCGSTERATRTIESVPGAGAGPTIEICADCGRDFEPI